MACNPEVLKHVPLFALLDEEETAVLAAQVELKSFAPRQRIYKMGDPSGQAYVMVSGEVPSSNRRDRHGRNRVPGSQPGRHRDAAATQAARGNGHVDGAGAAVPRVAATRAPSRNAQSERSDRGEIDAA